MLLVFATLSAAGCKKQIDNAKAEASIKSGLEAKGVKPESVSCPAAKTAKKGDSFECTGKLGGKDFTVAVEQLDDDGNVKWTLKGYILNSKDVVAKAGAFLPAGSTLTCADRPMTIERGPSTLDCETKNPDSKIQIVFAEDGSMKAVPVGGADEPKAGEHDEPKHDDEKKE